ncbi:hypothetical protein MNBD_GAMMA20-1475 [hydrothermal vent metagenome]|uniref:Uncharacterized protein n=1 Tax=hydrothermal vent metagenome TaxID=652676 RepID=A0A3B0ZKE6_9ZZZZ
MINITTEQIDCALLRVESGLEKYLSLQDRLKKIDVSNNREFQKRFNHFYRVRRNNDWQSQYYKILQEHKNKEISFADALKKIHKNTEWLEASFASKLVATVHPEKPVIDKFVLENADLKLPYPSAKDREIKIVSVYSDLETKFKDFLKTENGKYLVKQFQVKFPNAKITTIKMADLVLWQTR